MKYLIKFDANWSDEFDCQQFVIVDSTEGALNDIQSAIEYGASFGTNEGFEPGELTEGNFEIIELNDAEIEVFERCFPRLQWGFGTGIL